MGGRPRVGDSDVVRAPLLPLLPLLSVALVAICACVDRAGVPERERSIDEVRPHAVLADGRRVEVRSSGMGESELFLVDAHGARPIASAPGPDDAPLALSDGRVAFVSGRTGIASVYVVDVATGALAPLTNVDVKRAKDPRFVPPPIRALEEKSGALEWTSRRGRERVVLP
jgi:hypothetical protein